MKPEATIRTLEPKDVTTQTAVRLAELAKQLQPAQNPAESLEWLEAVISQPSVYVVLAETEGSIVGMLTLAGFAIPNGWRAHIEDVVVDASYRGRGIGNSLLAEAVRIGRSRNWRTLSLTCRSHRKEAIRLYLNFGFKAVETSVYRFTL